MRNRRGLHLLTVCWMLRATPAVPVREVQGEVAGWKSVVHVMVLHCVQDCREVPRGLHPLQRCQYDGLQRRDEGRYLISCMPTCTTTSMCERSPSHFDRLPVNKCRKERKHTVSLNATIHQQGSAHLHDGVNHSWSADVMMND
jgi:hypothetical protein